MLGRFGGRATGRRCAGSLPESACPTAGPLLSQRIRLARAYVSGDLDVDGDIFALLDVPELVTRLGENRLSTLPLRSIVRAAGTFAGLGAVGPPPSPPPAIEMRSKRGKRHSRSRDSATVSHHYDVGNRFYELFLGPSMVYSCGYWPEGVESLEAAQYAKLDLICRKLDLKPGMRLLDVAAVGDRWHCTPPRTTASTSSESR